MTEPKLARTREEMRFAASLEPCPSCGTRDLGVLELRGGGGRWTYDGTCPSCGGRRQFEFSTHGDPTIARAGRFDLGAGVSTLISADDFLAVLDDAAPRIPDDPSALSPAQRRDALAQVTRALTSVTELLKLVPPGGQPHRGDARLVRPVLEREYLRLKRVLDRYRPASSIDLATLDAHRAWLARGGSGPGHLTVSGKSLADQWYGPVDLTFAAFTDVDLSRVELGYAILDEAELVRCTLHATVLDGASVTNARITGGDWSGVRLSTARLNAAEIDGTDFAGADLERSFWYDAKVRGVRFDGARFANSVFERAVFERCSFREASFRRAMPEPAPTSRGARFVDCDFTGVSFADRDLRDTKFVRCKLTEVLAPAGGDSSEDVGDR